MSNGTDLHRDPSVLLCLEEGKNLFAHFVRGWDARARLQLAVRLKHKYAAIIRVAKFAERRRGFIVLGQLGQLLRFYHLAPSAHSARGEEGTAGRLARGRRGLGHGISNTDACRGQQGGRGAYDAPTRAMNQSTRASLFVLPSSL